MFNSRKLIGATSTSEVVPEAVDFDGTADNLSRAVDLTGNVDGTKFTLSVWLYPTNLVNFLVPLDIGSATASNGFSLQINLQGDVIINADNQSSTPILRANGDIGFVLYTWCHLLVSVDLSNTANRHIYVNDVAISTTWSTYVLNSSIDFTQAAMRVGNDSTEVYPYKGRLAHLFLDYAYRDLNIVSNRRNFITEDLKPADVPLPTPIYVGSGFDLTNTASAAGIVYTGSKYLALDSTGDDIDIYDDAGIYSSSGDASPAGGRGGCWDGTSAWFLGNATNVAAEYNGEGIDQSNTFSLSGEISTPIDICWDGTAFWVLNNNRNVFKYNAAGVYQSVSFDVGDSLPLSGQIVNGIEFLGGSFWFLKQSGGIYQFDDSGVYTGHNFDTDSRDTGLIALGQDGTRLITVDATTDFSRFYNPLGIQGEIGGYPISLADGTTGSAVEGDANYLKKTGGLTGAVDSKTFTTSMWVWIDPFSGFFYPYTSIAATGFGKHAVFVNPGNSTFQGRNAAGTLVLNMTAVEVPVGEWAHVICSVDLSDTGKRHVFVNGVDATPTWGTYVNEAINFNHGIDDYIGSTDGTETKDGRVAHLFHDYTYRDLTDSTELVKFYAGVGQPATGQASLSPILYMPLIDDFLNYGTGGSSFTETGTVAQGETDLPILYLPMVDAATAGDNLGFGGDFTINGNPQTASRGPNQDNCVASTLADSVDSLYGAGAAVSGKLFTWSFNIRPNTDSQTYSLETFVDANNRMIISTLTGQLQIEIFVSGWLLDVRINGVLAPDRLTSVSASVDLSDTGKRHVFIDGVDRTADCIWSSYSNTALSWTATVGVNIIYTFGKQTIGEVGEYYFDTDYIDLSLDNPFWDSTTDRPNSLRKVLDDTGNTPLVALPIKAGDEGNNLGSVGNFTIGGGPFVSARGGSEFWARSAWNQSITTTTVATNYLKRTALGGNATGVDATVVMLVRPWVFSFQDNHFFNIGASTNSFTLKSTTAEQVLMMLNGTNYAFSASNQLKDDTWMLVAMTVQADPTSPLTILHTKNQGLAVDRATNTGPLSSVDLSGDCWLGSSTGGQDFPGAIAMCYIVDSFVDMDDSDIWSIFFDRLDYPRDLTQAIAGGDIPTPLVYMKFDDLDDLGFNSGTGGDFTINGTIEPSSDVGE